MEEENGKEQTDAEEEGVGRRNAIEGEIRAVKNEMDRKRERARN